jgi:15-hydroxyprostaglandin dehydrogenase (NAD)
MPAYVDTNLTPSALTKMWPPEWITPISTLLRAFDELTSPTGAIATPSLSDGVPNQIKTGEAVEGVVDKLYYRKPVEYADESQRFCIETAALDLEGGIWWKGMRKAMEEAMAAQQQTKA